MGLWQSVSMLLEAYVNLLNLIAYNKSKFVSTFVQAIRPTVEINSKAMIDLYNLLILISHI